MYVLTKEGRLVMSEKVVHFFNVVFMLFFVHFNLNEQLNVTRHGYPVLIKNLTVRQMYSHCIVISRSKRQFLVLLIYPLSVQLVIVQPISSLTKVKPASKCTYCTTIKYKLKTTTAHI